MAVGHILFNDQLPASRKLRSFLTQLDQTVSDGNELLLQIAQMKDSGAVGQYIADEFGFGLHSGANVGTAGSVPVAQAAVAEFESLMGKLNTSGGDSAQFVKDAILQAIAKFG